VIAHKQRDYSKANTIESINILSAEPVEGKTLWIVDDMIDTAGSVDHLVRALEALEPAEVNIMAVHAVFSHPAIERLSKLHEMGLLNRVVVTDTVCGALKQPWMETVTSVELSAKVIRAIESNSPMSKLLQEFNVEKYLSGKQGKLFPNGA
jgi:ribose-phosphate pyrophosphokinase